MGRKKGHGTDCCNVFFLTLYTVSLAIALTAIVYATLCDKYMDWIKNLALSAMVSIAVLAMGAFMDNEHLKSKPFKYVIWFSRVFMLFLTVNLMVDAYHLSTLSGYDAKAYILLLRILRNINALKNCMEHKVH